jgi:hypothetical protein
MKVPQWKEVFNIGTTLLSDDQNLVTTSENIQYSVLIQFTNTAAKYVLGNK